MTIGTQATGKQWLVSSESHPGTFHVVKRIGSQFSCTCDGSFYRGRCKHADAVAAQLEPWRAQGFTVDPSMGIAILTGKTMRA
jgi:hypothetical protein